MNPPRVQVFDFDRWKKHRSASRYLRHVRATFTSRIVSCSFVPLSASVSLGGAGAQHWQTVLLLFGPLVCVCTLSEGAQPVFVQPPPPLSRSCKAWQCR